MFYLIPLDLDQQRTKPYKKYNSETHSFLDGKAYIATPPNEQQWYFNELQKLSSRYNVKEEHFEYLVYILGQHFLNYQTVEEKKIDAFECYEPLRFLKLYLEQEQTIIKTSKSEEALKSNLSSRFIEVHSPRYKSDPPITLSNASFIIKAIYQLFKEQHHYSLQELLEPYDDIPKLEIINKLYNKTEYIVNHATHYFIAEITEDLLDYMEKYMTKDLSRKQYLFIFDLLLLSNVFTFIDDEESQFFQQDPSYSLNNLEATIKTAYIKRIVKNYRKYMNNKQ